MPASVFNQVTVSAPAGSAAPATQLVEASDQLDVLVFNTSTTGVAYLTEVNSSLSTDAGTPRVSPLGPQQSIVFNGELDVFAVVAPGVSVVLNLYPSATNYTPYTPITELFTGNAATGTAGQAVTPVTGLISAALFQSLDIFVSSYVLPASTTGVGFGVQGIVSWFDTDGAFIGRTIFGIMGTPNALAATPCTTSVSIPCRGSQFSFSIGNPSSAPAAHGTLTAGSLIINGSFRQRTNISYNCDLSPMFNVLLDSFEFTEPTWHAPSVFAPDNWVVEVQDNETGVTLAYVCKGYAGSVQGYANVVAALNKNAYFVDLSMVRFGDGIADGNSGTIARFGSAVGITPLDFMMPAAPVALIVQYPAGAGQLNCSLVGNNTA